MNPGPSIDVITRIQGALVAAVRAISPLMSGNIRAEYKKGNHLVTAADRIANAVLRDTLVCGSEGWLSEESTDDLTRLKKRLVWIVDPLDGTREFVAGIPEWSISIALIQDGQPIAGGVCNPATQESFVGSLATGVLYNGKPCRPSDKRTLLGAQVLASRSEFEAGEWQRFKRAPFTIKPVGSVAYKLALVAAGAADATWTLRPKHEWDVAGGVALIRAGGGVVRQLGTRRLAFNSRSPTLSNLVASGSGIASKLPAYLKECMRRRVTTTSGRRAVL
ncbi:MAG: 3'(2'),5'-bisphosphate nucleotidase CysQ [Candidatus Acidiferrales bacterium]